MKGTWVLFAAFSLRDIPTQMGRFHRDPRPFERYVLAYVLARMGSARRWWLVECESAEAGRALIAFAQHEATGGHWYGAVGVGIDAVLPCSCGHVLGETLPGRILDSGTNEARP